MESPLSESTDIPIPNQPVNSTVPNQTRSYRKLFINTGLIAVILLVIIGASAYYLNLSKARKVQTADNTTSPTPVKEEVEIENRYRNTNINGLDVPFKQVSMTELFDISKNYGISQSKIGVQQNELVQISCSDNYLLNESHEPVVQDDMGKEIAVTNANIKELFSVLNRDFPESESDAPYLVICKTNDSRYFGRFDSYYNKSLPFFVFDNEFNIKWITPKSDQEISPVNNGKRVLGDVPKLCNYMLGLTVRNDLYYMCGGSDAQYASMNLHVINLDTGIARFIIHCSSQGDGSVNPTITTNCSDEEI